MSLKKNMIIPLTITDASLESGIGRYISEDYPEGFVVFVPYTAIGDVIDCKIVKVEKKYAFGIVNNIICKSLDRVDVQNCPVYGKCGGCSWRHITYDAELRYKEKHVKDCLERIGGLNVDVSPIVESDEIDHYRNKAQYPIAKENDSFKIGFYAQRSHRIVQNWNCALQPSIFNNVLDVISNWIQQFNVLIYDENSKKGLLRHIYIRQGQRTKQLMVCLVVTKVKVPNVDQLIDQLRVFDNLTSVVININNKDTNVILGNECITLYGKDNIEDVICDNVISISPMAFYQVNTCQAEKLYTIAASIATLSKQDILLDMYCGTGTIGLSMAKHVKKVIGVEVVPEAITNAKQNAKINNINNIDFICSDASDAIKKLYSQSIRPNVVVLDPPRKGCDVELLNIIQQMNVDKIVYISCNPSTLARDLSYLTRKLYVVEKVVPVDMFPRTSHVEMVVLLSRMNTTK